MRNLYKLVVIALALIFASGILIAQEKTAKMETMAKKTSTYKGYLTDKMCGTGFTKTGDAKTAAAKAKKHTKDCALADHCAASGFGLVMNGKFHKFDAAGDTAAMHYLNSTKKDSDLLVAVNGTMDGENINVNTIKDAKK